MNHEVQKMKDKISWLIKKLPKDPVFVEYFTGRDLPTTQAALARTLGVTPSRLSNWLSDQPWTPNPAEDVIERLLAFYGIEGNADDHSQNTAELTLRCVEAWHNGSLEDFIDAFRCLAEVSGLTFKQENLNISVPRSKIGGSPLEKAKRRELSALFEQIALTASVPKEASRTASQLVKDNSAELLGASALSQSLNMLSVEHYMLTRAANLIKNIALLSPILPEPGMLLNDGDPLYSPDLVAIPNGEFSMGSDPASSAKYGTAHFKNEEPVHTVNIERPFAIGVFPITQSQYQFFCTQTGRKVPHDNGWIGNDLPVVNVDWQDAQVYCRWLSSESRAVYRLPSESEWEYCCRAGTKTPFYFGNEVSETEANHNGSIGQTTSQGQFAPNSFGIFDMHGNVWEWVQDTWHENYQGAPADGSAWFDHENPKRIMRGGCWQDGPVDLRSANRKDVKLTGRGGNIGFRILRELT